MKDNNIFVLPKVCLFLEKLFFFNSNGVEPSCAFLSRKCGVTYSYVHHLCVVLEGRDFLVVKKVGRRSFIRLSKKGLVLAKKFIDLKKMVED